MSNHIADANKMVDTPRTDAAYAASTGAGIYELFKESQDIERELNAANQIIRQQQLLEEENLRLKDKIAQLYAWAEEQKQRIKRLDEENLRMLDYIKQLEEGGDRAILNSYFPDRLTIWTKAKEAKP